MLYIDILPKLLPFTIISCSFLLSLSKFGGKFGGHHGTDGTVCYDAGHFKLQDDPLMDLCFSA